MGKKLKKDKSFFQSGLNSLGNFVEGSFKVIGDGVLNIEGFINNKPEIYTKVKELILALEMGLMKNDLSSEVGLTEGDISSDVRMAAEALRLNLQTHLNTYDNSFSCNEMKLTNFVTECADSIYHLTPPLMAAPGFFNQLAASLNAIFQWYFSVNLIAEERITKTEFSGNQTFFNCFKNVDNALKEELAASPGL